MPSKNKRARIDAGRVKAWLVRLIRLGLSLILISPLLAWSGFLFPHITAKVLSFQILLEIVLAAALFLVAIDEALRRHLLRVASSPLFLALGLLMGYTLAGSMLGVDPLRSLWGLIDRQDGLVLLFHFFSWMLVVTWFYSVPPVTGRVDRPEASPEFSHGPGLHGYLGFSYWISAAVALTAVAQHPQIQSLEIFQYLGSVVALGTAERVSGVFGNPIALGPYLSLHFFYGMYQLWSIASKPGTGHGVQSRDREIAVRSGALGAELRG
ncbi:MAG: hypothetical protein FJW35_19110, partial [Acidobacteria bacterium]|nr:hypothetical protein [Acidobacteriota bacterium]